MPWNFDNDRSIYIQLVEQIQNRIIMEEYAPGSRMKPVRELAGEAEVNPNTMQKALAELERIGLLHAQRTSGRFVTDDTERIEAMRQKLAQEITDKFLKQMENLGYRSSEIIQMIREMRGGDEDE